MQSFTPVPKNSSNFTGSTSELTFVSCSALERVKKILHFIGVEAWTDKDTPLDQMLSAEIKQACTSSKMAA